MLHGFLPFSPAPLTEWCSFWYGLGDLFTLHKLDGRYVKTDEVKSGRKEVDPNGWLRDGRG